LSKAVGTKPGKRKHKGALISQKADIDSTVDPLFNNPVGTNVTTDTISIARNLSSYGSGVCSLPATSTIASTEPSYSSDVCGLPATSCSASVDDIQLTYGSDVAGSTSSSASIDDVQLDSDVTDLPATSSIASTS